MVFFLATETFPFSIYKANVKADLNPEIKNTQNTQFSTFP